MDRNRITRTGARTPGGERASLLEWRCLSAQRSPTQSGDLHAESGEHEGRMQTMKARQLGVIRGKALLTSQPRSRTGENPPYGCSDASCCSSGCKSRRWNLPSCHCSHTVSYTHLRANETVLDLVC